MSFSRLYEMYKNRINITLSFFLRQLPFQDNPLLQAMKYSTLSKNSKRLRSCLVYAAGESFRSNISTLDTISAAIECVHTYSLIHDDLPCMDNDSMRRGNMSCHIKYSENIALIAGDALQSLAFNILSEGSMPSVSYFKRIKMISELSSSIGASGMCMGQVLDLLSEFKNVNLSELKEINLYKTAFFIRSSVRLVLISSNYLSKTMLAVLDNFAICLGLAFQIQDDILDLSYDMLKNNVNKNKKIKKYTYPSIIGLDESEKIVATLYKKAFSLLNTIKKNFNTDTLTQLTQFMFKRIE